MPFWKMLLWLPGIWKTVLCSEGGHHCSFYWWRLEVRGVSLLGNVTATPSIRLCSSSGARPLVHWMLYGILFYDYQPSSKNITHSDVRLFCCTSESLVERHRSSLKADNRLAYNVLQKTNSTRKVFSFSPILSKWNRSAKQSTDGSWIVA